MLEQRPLGSTGLSLSVLGLGTVKFGRNTGVKYPESFELPDLHSLDRLMNQAYAGGINYLDTAPAYGLAEERLGVLLKKRADRHNWILFSKVGENYCAQSQTSRYAFEPDAIRASIEQSLNRLATDYLDGILVHSDGRDLAIIHDYGVFEVLADQKKRGLIRSYGMSIKTIEGGIAALEKSDYAMVTLNPQYQNELGVIEHARKLGKGILVKKSLASGHIGAPLSHHSQSLRGQSSAVADALRFSLNTKGVTSIVLGTIHPGHLSDNLHAVCYDRGFV